MRARKRFGIAAVYCGLLPALLGALPASARTARLEAVARMLQQNERELARYSWKSRTEISVEGEIGALAQSMQELIDATTESRNGNTKRRAVQQQQEPSPDNSADSSDDLPTE